MRGFLKIQEWMIYFHHDIHAERDWNLPLNFTYLNLSGKGQIKMVNIVSPASCLDADRTFILEVLNTDQTNICKKKTKPTNKQT